MRPVRAACEARAPGAGDAVQAARSPGTRSVVPGLLTALGAAALVAVLVVGAPGCASSDDEAQPGAPTASVAFGDAALARAFDERAVDLPVAGRGTVVRLLADDVEGGRHQRFIVQLASGQTLLVAHNIDVAPRVEGLRVGDPVTFRGVYEWNAEGGVVHWTHHDPVGSHAPGWILHEGQRYQ